VIIPAEKIGTYELHTVETDKAMFTEWMVFLSENSTYTTDRQDSAEIISRLVRIERKLNPVPGFSDL